MFNIYFNDLNNFSVKRRDLVLKFKRDMIIISLIICLIFTISSVCAVDSEIQAINVQNSTDEVVSTVNENDLEINDGGEILAEADGGTIAELNNKIQTAIQNGDSEVKLYNNYTYGDSETIITNNLQGKSNNGIGISDDLIIDGQNFTINGNNRGARIFSFFDDSKTITFKNINFINCRDSLASSIFGICKDINLINCNFTNNQAITSGMGGAVYVKPTNVNVINCTFTNNYAYQYGGALYLQASGSSQVINSTFFGNEAGKYGGAIFYNSPNANFQTDIDRCIFINNKANQNYGSAIFSNTNGFYNLNNCILLNNTGNTINLPDSSSNVEYNWWGHTSSNCEDDSLLSTSVGLSNWLYLDINSDNGIAEVSLNNLYAYTVGNSAYANYDLPEIRLDISTSSNAQVNVNNVTINKTGKAQINYYVSKVKENLTASYHGVELTKNLLYYDDGSFNSLKSFIMDTSADDEIIFGNNYLFSYDKDSAISGNGIDIDKPLIINGNGHIVNANWETNVFNIYGDVTIKNTIFTNCVSNWGGVFYVDVYSLTIINCTFIDNGNINKDGGVFYSYGNINVINSTFINNNGNFGSVVLNYNSIDFDRCVFVNNTNSIACLNYDTSMGITPVTNIDNSILINNTGNIFIMYAGSAEISDSWLGNTIDDPGKIPSVGEGVTINNWYVLDMNLTNQNSTISLNNLFDGNNICPSVNYNLPAITLSIKKDNIPLDDKVLNESGKIFIEQELSRKYSLTVGYNSISLTKKYSEIGTFSQLKDKINAEIGEELTLEKDYYYDSELDKNLENGIEFAKNIIINGNGKIIDANKLSRIFYINDDSKTVKFKNIKFLNATGYDGSVIYVKGSKVEIINCTFENNVATNSLVYADAEGNVSNSIFINNTSPLNIKGTGNVIVDNNWWGNNADNYISNITNVDGVSVSKWYFLNMTVDEANSIITFTLNNIYVNGGQQIYSDYALPTMTLNIKVKSLLVDKVNITFVNYENPTINYTLLNYTGNITACYGDVNFTRNIEFVDDYSFTALQKIISFTPENRVLNLENDYVYNPTTDSALVSGIRFTKPIIINGKNHKIDAQNMARIFVVDQDITFGLIKFVNAMVPSGKGGAVIYNLGSECAFYKCSFINNSADLGGVIYNSKNNVDNQFEKCIFENNSATNGGVFCDGLIHCNDCTFINNSATDAGGVYRSQNTGNDYYKNCIFINNSAVRGAVIYNSNSNNDGNIHDSKFIGNNIIGSDNNNQNSIIYSYYNSISGCTFINNTANYAIIFYPSTFIQMTILNSIFLNNTATNTFYGLIFNCIVANYNWFGNTFDNFDERPALSKNYIVLNNWLYLDANLHVNHADISLKLYEQSTPQVNYPSYSTPEITLNLNSTTLDLENDTVTLDSSSKGRVDYTMGSDSAALTMSYENVKLTKEYIVGDFDVLQDLIDAEATLVELDRNYTYIFGGDSITSGIAINKNIVIDGKGHTIDAKENTRIFNIQGGEVTFKNITFVNAKAGDGAVISVNSSGGKVNIINCTFANSTSSGFGGAIYLNTSNSEFNLYNSSFINIKAKNGGALYIASNNTTVTIDKCLFRKNVATGASSSGYATAILWNTTNDDEKNNVVKNSIFLDQSSSGDNRYAFVLKSGKVNINENWWGTKAQSNPNQFSSNYAIGIIPTSWLFINGTKNVTQVYVNEPMLFKFILQLYDQDLGVCDYDNSKLPKIILPVSSAFGSIDKTSVSFNESIIYKATKVSKPNEFGGPSLVTSNINKGDYEYKFETRAHSIITLLVDNQLTMYSSQHYSFNEILKFNAEESSVTIETSNSSVVALKGGLSSYGLNARSRGTALITFSYSGSDVDLYDDTSEYLMITVDRIPLKINVTNLESDEITVYATDTINLNITLAVDDIHESYGNAQWDKLSYEKKDDDINGNIMYSKSTQKNVTGASVNGTLECRVIFPGTSNLTLYYRDNENYYDFENVTIRFTVLKKPTAIELDHADQLELKVDETSKINATVINGTDIPDLTYESSDTDIVQITNQQTGEFKANGKGTAIITVKYSGNVQRNESTKKVTVNVLRYDTVTTAANKEISLKIGEKLQIEATLNPDVGALKYSCDNVSVATVNEDTGLITAVGNGTATITVRYPGDRKYEISEDTITVTVSKNATEITAEDKTIKSTDENIPIGATLNITDEYTLHYSSNNESVVTVSDDGKLTAVGAGEAQVTITYDESEKYLASTKTINVVVQRVATEIFVDETSISTNYLKEITLNPTVKADGNPLVSAMFSYFIGDEQISNPFTVDRVGEFNITVKYAQNSKYEASELNITVNADKADNYIVVVVDDASYPDNITVKVNATVAGTYTIDINGTAYDVVANDTDGKSVKLAAGSYYANVTGYNSDFYNGITTNDTFAISKATNDVTVNIHDKYLPGEVTVSVSATVSGTYHVVINGTYNVDVVVGANGAGQNTIALPAGVKYQANTTFADHQNYTVSITNATFDVNKSDVDLEIFIDPVNYGENATIIVRTNVTGTYTVKIANEDEFTIDLDAGIKTFYRKVSLNVANGYHAEISIAETDNYKSKTSETTFNVVRGGTNFKVNSTKGEYHYGEKIVFKIELPEDATGSVTFNYTDGTLIGEITDVTQKEFTMPTILKVGTYIVRATYNGDTNYNSTSKTFNFNVTPAENHITVNVENVTYPNVATVKVTADVDGIYKVNINGTDYNVSANGEEKYIKLAAGTYYANVTYFNENYTAVSKNATFTVNKGINVVVVNVEDIEVPGDVTVRVTATLAGTYTVNINGTEVDVAVGTNGVGSGTVALPAGVNYHATSDGAGNGNYTDLITGCTFTINKINPNINATDIVVDVKGTNTTVIQTPAGFDGKFTYESSDESIAVVNESTGVVTGVSSGTATITIRSYDAENYTDDSTEFNVTVNRIDSDINVVESEFDVDVNANKSIDYTGEFDGTIKFVSNDTSVAIVNETTGVVTGISSGKVKITVNATGSAKYNDKTINVNVTVNKIASDIGVETDSFDVDVKANESIIVTGGFDGTIEFISNDTSVAIVDENGVVTGVSGGKANITVKATGSSKYDDASLDVIITVNRIAPNLSADDLVIEIGKSQSIVIEPTDFDGIITYKISDESIATVDSDGKVTAISLGNATVTITAKDSAKYTDDSITINVTVAKVQANGLEIIYNDTFELDVGDTEDILAVDAYNRQITYSSCNESVAVVNSEGQILAVGGGVVNITVSVAEDLDHQSESKNITVTVYRIPSYIEVEDSLDVDVKENKFIEMDLPTDYDGEISYEVNDTSVAAVDDMGNVTGIKAGKTTVTVTFTNSPTYLDETFEVIVTVSRISPSLDVNPKSVEIIGGEKTGLVVGIDDDYDGIITFESSNSSIASIDANGIITAVNDGTVTVTVKASETERFLAEAKEITVSVGKLTYEITLDISDITAGENATAIITATDAGTLNITITNGFEVIKSENIDVSTYCKYVIPDLTVGLYNISARYSGSERYKGFEISKEFRVNPDYNYIFAVEIDDTVLGQTTNATVLLPSDATGTIMIGGKDYEIKTVITLPVQNVSGKNSVIVEYIPDGKSPYGENTIIVYYNVAKKDSDIKINVRDDIKAGESVDIVIETYDGANITVYVDGEKQVVDNGKVTITPMAGTHTVIASVAENDQYVALASNRTFEVTKTALTFTVNSSDVRVGGNAVIDINITDLATGKVIVNVNGTEYSVSLDLAKSIDVVLDKAGNYTVSAKYLGDGIFEQADSNVIAVQAIEKDPANISVEIPQDVHVGDKIVINVTSDNDNLTVEINGETQAIKDGKVEYAVNNAGSYSVVVNAGESPEYAKDAYVTSFTAEKNPAEVEIIMPQTIEIGKDIEISIKSYENANITVYVDGVLQKLTDRKFVIMATAGTHTIIAGVEETDMYMKASANETFTVEKLESAISVNTTNAKVGENATVTVNVTQKATGIVIVNVAGKDYSIDLRNTTSLDVLMNSPGTFNVTARYLGDDIFKASEASLTAIEVTEKETPEVNVTLPEIKAGENGNVSLNIPNATGLVYVIIDGVAQIADLDENGSAVIPIDNASAGNHTITVIYTGDENNDMSIQSQSFSIDKQTSDVNVTVDDIELGKDSQIEISVPNATGNVSVIIDGVEVSVPLDENGNVNFTVPSLAAGKHSIVVVYPGDDTHAPAIITQQINATAKASELKDIVVSGEGTITAVLVDEDGYGIANTTVSYFINGNKMNTTTNANGEIIIKASPNSKVEIEYSGDSQILPANTTIELKDLAPQRHATLIQSQDYTTYAIDYYAGERGNYFKVRLVDENGNAVANRPVKIGFNGVVYDRTTDGNGWTQLQINLMNAGECTFAVSFLGDDEYNASFVVNKIIVNKKPTSFKATAKSFKASAKTKSYTVTLKTVPGSSIDGKAYLKAGKKVTLKLNGVTYTAKINAKGQATFKLQISKKGKFVGALNFEGDGTYLAASAKVKISIK